MESEPQEEGPREGEDKQLKHGRLGKIADHAKPRVIAGISHGPARVAGPDDSIRGGVQVDEGLA